MFIILVKIIKFLNIFNNISGTSSDVLSRVRQTKCRRCRRIKRRRPEVEPHVQVASVAPSRRRCRTRVRRNFPQKGEPMKAFKQIINCKK